MRRLAMWLGGLGLLLAGVGLGTALGYVSLVLPRQAELRRRDRPSPSLEGFRPKERLEALVGAPVELLHHDAERRGVRQTTRARSFLFRAAVPADRHAALLDAFSQSCKADIEKAGHYIAAESKSVTGGPRATRTSYRLTYQGTDPGCLHIGGFGQDDGLTIQVEMHDDR